MAKRYTGASRSPPALKRRLAARCTALSRAVGTSGRGGGSVRVTLSSSTHLARSWFSMCLVSKANRITRSSRAPRVCVAPVLNDFDEGIPEVVEGSQLFTVLKQLYEVILRHLHDIED